LEVERKADNLKKPFCCKFPHRLLKSMVFYSYFLILHNKAEESCVNRNETRLPLLERNIVGTSYNTVVLYIGIMKVRGFWPESITPKPA